MSMYPLFSLRHNNKEDVSLSSAFRVLANEEETATAVSRITQQALTKALWGRERAKLAIQKRNDIQQRRPFVCLPY